MTNERPAGGDRLGVLGSSFNPPHLGHLVLAGEARWQLDLDRVLLVPTGIAYHKEALADPGGTVRLAMAEAAVAGLEDISVERIEIERGGPSYTCDTLEEIAKLNPDSEIDLLMGADAALGFGNWRKPERILDLARVAVAPRENLARSEVDAVFEGFGRPGRVRFIDMPLVGISSSMVRERLRGGLPYRHLLPARVAEMIENGGLYDD